MSPWASWISQRPLISSPKSLLRLLQILVWRPCQRSSRKEVAPDPLAFYASEDGADDARIFMAASQLSIVRSRVVVTIVQGTSAGYVHRLRCSACSGVIPVPHNVQKFGHSSDIILIYLFIRRNVGRDRTLKRSSIDRDTGKCLRGL